MARKGDKLTVTPKKLAANRANAAKDRPRGRCAMTKLERELARLRAMTHREFILGEGAMLIREIAMGGRDATPGEIIRAWEALGDRCGVPRMTVQDVRHVEQQAPLIEFVQTAYERPGQETQPEVQ